MQKRHGILSAVAAVLAVLAGPGEAQNVLRLGAGEPTFRRVQPPGEGFSGPRITIQIEPRAEEPPEPEPELAAPAPLPPEATEGWFWARVSPAIAADRPFPAAMEHLRSSEEAADLNIARLDDLGRIAAQHGRHILTATVGTEVSPALVLAVMAVESAGRADAQSHAGAQGLMQLIPATAARFGVSDPFDPEQNIRGGVAYLQWLLEEFDGDPVLALAGYNAGEGAVREWGGVPDYAETRAYVPKVLATFDLARSLCLTPPEFTSDGCVFATMTGG